MAEIDIRGVKKRFGETQVIHGIDLHVADGEFIVVVGPSGCGKSTLLRMIAGLERISEGEIVVAGRVVNDLEPKDRGTAMVFQNYALYPHMSVFDNMAYGLKIARKPKVEILQRVHEAARILAIDELLERRPRQLSGGQRQRVAMGRAIVREPQAFLFDEPLSNLDATLRVQMRLEIKQLQRRLGTTSVFVTHDQVEAMTLADRLMVMNEGRAEQVDTPMAVYERPESLFVASFIGSPAMNLLSAETDGKGGLRLSGGVSLPAPSVPVESGRRVTLGIRPEHLKHVQDGGSFELAVELIETLGADTLAHGRLEHDGIVLTVRLPGTLAVSEGDRLRLEADPEAMHLFDPETGRRVAARV